MFKSQTCATIRYRPNTSFYGEQKCIHCLLQSWTCVTVTTSRDLNAARNALKPKNAPTFTSERWVSSGAFSQQKRRQSRLCTRLQKPRPICPRRLESVTIQLRGKKQLRWGSLLLQQNPMGVQCSSVYNERRQEEAHKNVSKPDVSVNASCFQYASFLPSIFFLNKHLLPT